MDCAPVYRLPISKIPPKQAFNQATQHFLATHHISHPPTTQSDQTIPHNYTNTYTYNHTTIPLYCPTLNKTIQHHTNNNTIQHHIITIGGLHTVIFIFFYLYSSFFLSHNIWTTQHNTTHTQHNHTHQTTYNHLFFIETTIIPLFYCTKY